MGRGEARFTVQYTGVAKMSLGAHLRLNFAWEQVFGGRLCMIGV